MESTVVQSNSQHTGAGTEWTGKKSYWWEWGEDVGGSRPEGSSGIGPGGQAAISLTPDFNGTTSDFLLDSFYLSS